MRSSADWRRSAFGPTGLATFVETDDLDVSYVSVKRLPDGMR